VFITDNFYFADATLQIGKIDNKRTPAEAIMVGCSKYKPYQTCAQNLAGCQNS